MNILLTVAYDGEKYNGWQRQKNAVGVQQVLEDTLTALFSASVTLTGSSRTDTGVHALDQKAAFHVAESPIPLEKLPYVLNNMLPRDISVTKAEAVPEDFNPRYMAIKKTYVYQIYNADFRNPLYKNAWFYPYEMDVDKMINAAKDFIGIHDFAAFRASGSSVGTSVREIYRSEVKRDGSIITFTVTGSGFLYNMVRIMIGTLAYIGQGKLVEGSIPGIIQSRDRTQAGKTAPPEGLTLTEVELRMQ